MNFTIQQVDSFIISILSHFSLTKAKKRYTFGVLKLAQVVELKPAHQAKSNIYPEK